MKVMAELQLAVELGPDYMMTHYLLGSALIAKLQYGPGIRELERAVVLSDSSTMALSGLARALAVADRVMCMLEGRAVFSAPAAQTTRDEILAAYFGLGAVAT